MMKVMFFEHIEQDADGKIKPGTKLCVPCELSTDEVMQVIKSEIEAMLDGHDDIKLLLTMGDMTEEEMVAAGEFEGW